MKFNIQTLLNKGTINCYNYPNTNNTEKVNSNNVIEKSISNISSNANNINNNEVVEKNRVNINIHKSNNENNNIISQQPKTNEDTNNIESTYTTALKDKQYISTIQHTTPEELHKIKAQFNILINKGDTSIETEIDKYLATYPTDIDFLSEKYYIQILNNKTEESYHYLQELIDILETDTKLLNNPDNQPILLKYIEYNIQHNTLSKIDSLIEHQFTEYVIYLYRSLYYRSKDNINKAYNNICKYIEHTVMDPYGYLYKGELEYCKGDYKKASESLSRSLQLDNSLLNSHIILGQVYKDLGDVESANMILQDGLKYTTKNIEIEAIKYNIAENYYKGGCRYKSLSTLTSISNSQRFIMKAIIQMAIGKYSQAIKLFDEMKDNPKSFYLRNIAIYNHNMLDSNILSFNLDKALSPLFKEGHCKNWNQTLVTDFKSIEYNESIKDLETPTKTDYTTKQQELINFGRIIKYNVDGYTDNFVQYISATLSIFMIKQLMETQKNWINVVSHIIALRQISEPLDTVYWINGLSEVQFKEGFGASTTMISNSVKVYRYYNMSKKAFELFKTNTDNNIRLTIKPSDYKSIEEFAETYKKSICVGTKLKLKHTGEEVEGTNLILDYNNSNDTYSFNISTPCKSGRWEKFVDELQKYYSKILICSPLDFDNIFELILSFGYYYYNFMPLSRGSACTGLLMMFGMFAKFGKKFSGKWKKDFQIDWEAILTNDVNEFLKSVEWMKNEFINYKFAIDIDLTTMTLRDFIEIIN